MTLTGEYDVQNIKFDCLRRTMDGYERKCAKLSDYGLQYVKYFAEACQEHQAIQIIEAIICWSCMFGWMDKSLYKKKTNNFNIMIGDSED